MKRDDITIKDLYPDIHPEKQAEVAEVFDRYLDFVLRTYEYLRANPRLYEESLSLTVPTPDNTIDPKGRSFTNQYPDTDV